MAICHQPYSELDKIPIERGLHYMQMTGDILQSFLSKIGTKLPPKPTDPKSSRNNTIVPNVLDPEEYFK